MWGALSDVRTRLSFTSAAGSRQRSHSVFISPMNRVAQLCPQTLGSLFVASYDSQGYGGGIRTRLHAGEARTPQKTPLPKSSIVASRRYRMDRVENTTSQLLHCRVFGAAITKQRVYIPQYSEDFVPNSYRTQRLHEVRATDYDI
jgi:hypothetical protein